MGELFEDLESPGVDDAFRAFFERAKRGAGKAGFPRFRSFQRWRSFGLLEWSGARISNGRPQITFGALRSRQEILNEAKDQLVHAKESVGEALHDAKERAGEALLNAKEGTCERIHRMQDGVKEFSQASLLKIKKFIGTKDEAAVHGHDIDNEYRNTDDNPFGWKLCPDSGLVCSNACCPQGECLGDPKG